MKYHCCFLLLLFYVVTGFCQEIKIDKTGKLTAVAGTGTLSAGDIKITTDFAVIREKILALVSAKIDTTILNLDNTAAYSYHRFYATLWTEDELDKVRTDLDAIRNYLANKTAPASLTYLDPFFQELKRLVNAASYEWYTINKTAMTSTDKYTLKSGDFDKKKTTVTLELRLNLLFNRMMASLFTTLYNSADMSALKAMPLHVYEQEKKSLAALVARLKPLGAYDYNNVNATALADFVQFNTDYNRHPMVIAVKTAVYFKNLLWWRNADITFNPFEWRYRDTASLIKPDTFYSSVRNVSLFNFYNQYDKKLNSVLLAQQQKNVREIAYFQNPDTQDDVSALANPLKSSESVRASVHNINDNEKVELRLVKSIAHNGMNNTLNLLDSAFTVWGNGLTDANTANAGWVDLLKQAQGIFKSLTTNFQDQFLTSAYLNGLTNPAQFWTKLKLELIKENNFNQYIFEEVQKTDAARPANLKKAITANSNTDKQTAIKTIIDDYTTTYDRYKDAVDDHYNDSLVVAFVYRMISESTRPTFTLAGREDDGSFSYRTELLQTTPTDDNVKQLFDIKRLKTINAKTDSSLIGSFSYKSSPPQLFGVSIGPAFTIANKYYARNTVTSTAGEAPTISSTHEIVNFTIGLNIYPWRIFTLDNNLFHSKASPFYTRMSLYLGLGFPKTLKNFYPGISYDIIAGIKVVGGVHCFIYDRYKITNNAISDQSSQFRAAGAFFSINIDPRIAIKAIGIIK